MDILAATERLSALAQPTRLSTFRMLVEAEPGGLAAGEIAVRLGVPHNTLSTHLAHLSRATLVTSRREGRSIIYRADIASLRSLLSYLISDCCQGRPDQCASVLDELLPLTREAV